MRHSYYARKRERNGKRNLVIRRNKIVQYQDAKNSDHTYGRQGQESRSNNVGRVRSGSISGNDSRLSSPVRGAEGIGWVTGTEGKTIFVNDGGDEHCIYGDSSFSESSDFSNSSQFLSFTDVSVPSTLFGENTDEINVNKSEEGKLKFYYTNADCLLNKMDELKVVLEIQNPDVIVVSEIFLKSINPTDIHSSEYMISGYQCFPGVHLYVE